MSTNPFNILSEDVYAEKMDALIKAINGGGCIHSQGAVPYGKELTASWSEIQAQVQTGNFDGINIGDWKRIQLTDGEEVVMEVAGIDQYYNPDYDYPENSHHIDFISRDCIEGYYIYNSNGSNNGTSAEANPFMASELYQTLNNTTDGIITRLPSDLRSCIIKKHAVMESRYSSSGTLTNNNSATWKEVGPLWLPTEVEVWGTAHWSEKGWGTYGGGANIQYPIFKGGLLHILKGYGAGGGRHDWWLASARAGSSNSFCIVVGLGYAGDSSADGVLCVPLCFRIG